MIKIEIHCEKGTKPLLELPNATSVSARRKISMLKRVKKRMQKHIVEMAKEIKAKESEYGS